VNRVLITDGSRSIGFAIKELFEKNDINVLVPTRVEDVCYIFSNKTFTKDFYLAIPLRKCSRNPALRSIILERGL
jgi:hypothetical protein